ncbi:GntP family permease [Flagellimonas sp.]|uniref:GntP family permease n=1 Tax=Flagellimonas sp. TaxID=2058762 RepID=UPI003F4A2ACE
MVFIVLIGAILFIILATVRLKMHPVLSLTIAAVGAGLMLGMTPSDILKTMGEGLGKTLSGIALVIAFGSIIGIYLEKTGATQILAQTILKIVGNKKSPMAINLAGFIVSIPVFCDSGFIILSRLNKALSKKSGFPVLVFAIALATGLYAAHVFVPPTPGPLAAAAILEADLGLVMLLGLLVALPVSLTGYFWARFSGKSLKQSMDGEENISEETHLDEDSTMQPIQAFLPLLVPIFLIALKSIVNHPNHPFGEGSVFWVLDFMGNPIIALLIGVVFAFALARRVSLKEKQGWVPEALKQAGAIVLITGAGGAFGAILRTIDIAESFDLNVSSGWLGLLIIFLIAATLKTAQGSSTVAIITTSAIIAPLLTNMGLVSEMDKALSVLAVGAGAMTVSHINDSYFWVVSQFSNMEVKEALKGFTLATLIQGLVGLTALMVLYLAVS